jgi:hypothetical protein
MMNVSQTILGSDESSAGVGPGRVRPLEMPQLLAEARAAAAASWRSVGNLAEDVVVAVLCERSGLPGATGMRAALTEPDAGEDPLGTRSTLSEASPVVLTGRKWGVARSASGHYAVLARQGTALSVVALRADDGGVTVEAAARPDPLGLDRVHLEFAEGRVGPTYLVDVRGVEEARSFAALIVAAAAVERLRMLMETATGAARDLAAERSPMRHHDGQFTMADSWRDHASAGRLVSQAGDQIAELGWGDPRAEETVCVAAIAATEALVGAADGLLRIFGQDAERIPGLGAEYLAAHEAAAAFVSNRRLRLRIAALRGMDA